MNNKKVAIILIGIIFLSGCTDMPKTSANTTANNIENNPELENQTNSTISKQPNTPDTQMNIILKEPPKEVIGGE